MKNMKRIMLLGLLCAGFGMLALGGFNVCYGASVIHSGTCLDVDGGRTANGTVVHIWQCQAGNRNQDWTFDNGRIVWTGTNKCLDVDGGRTANGTKVQIWDCQNGNTNQRWSLDTNFPGKIVWMGGKCLDVNAGGTATGTKVQTWDCMAGNDNQQWIVK
ncbi:MAG: RICIN domain-containing protein [Syntrophobacterales bacterium]|jgi:protocatechuate 3,4-dioxygenase beta subunit|nr:RICIN domain-containing protein [Syntrophobacterales bacterium]